MLLKFIIGNFVRVGGVS